MNQADLIRSFEAHAPALVLYARQWLDRSRAEDAVQEAYVRLLLLGAPPRNARAWLYRAVRNEAITQWRSARSRSRRERDVAVPEALFEQHEVAREEVEALTRALAKLPQPQREILVLRVWGGLTLAEISELVEAPLSSVFHQYKSALAAMREWMDQPCEKKTH
jgi:RNA polymerase sigma-70 factor (ECF subfamily)